MSFALQTDAYNMPLQEVQVARMVITEAEAGAASTTAILPARAATGPCKLVLIAATAETDILTESFPATSAATPVTAGIKIKLDANSSDALAVSASDTTGLITVLLASTTPANNTAAAIQAAIRGVTPGGGAAGVVKGISVAAIVCAAGGNWDTAAVAESSTTDMTAVAFAGGAGEDILPTASPWFTQPPSCRTITATAAGTGADIGAVSVIVYGTNINDQAISETLPVFVVNTAATKTGLKAFKTITKIHLPSHDGTGATVAVGYSEAFGIPFMFSKKAYLTATLDGVIETTAPTQVNDADEVEKNTVDINSSCNGKEICLYWLIPEA
jgi:hypothetical protein